MRYLCTFYKINLMSNLWSYLKIYHYIFEIKKHFCRPILNPNLDHGYMYIWLMSYPKSFETMAWPGLGWQQALQWALSSVSVLAERILQTLRRTGLDWDRSDWVTLNCDIITFIFNFNFKLSYLLRYSVVKQYQYNEGIYFTNVH